MFTWLVNMYNTLHDYNSILIDIAFLAAIILLFYLIIKFAVRSAIRESHNQLAFDIKSGVKAAIIEAYMEIPKRENSEAHTDAEQKKSENSFKESNVSIINDDEIII